MIIKAKAVCMTALASLVLAGPACGGDTFDVAVTVDDLPAHGKLPPGMTRVGIAASHLAAFKAHGVAQAFGFVNAAGIGAEPGSEAVLDLWRTHGHPLGNHTFSHMNLEHAPSLAAWQADVAAGEPAVAAKMAGAHWRYLRYPFLNAGAARQDGALAWLRARGYRIADVSLSFGDWAYTDAYARCVATGDAAAIARMKAHYLDEVDTGIARMKAESMRVFGRIIPQVLLTHIGGWSAATLPDVLARLDAAGARYVGLDQAQSDAAYAAPGGGTVIARVAAQQGIVLQETNGTGRALQQRDIEALCR